ncbi:MAG: glycosyltransferase family 2 protein [Dysgonomonas sp.]|uniref:glycosyltransferase family 2 protein n=1 Tax=Dysgonomonas sp. TaxID=1891233 RepID=UPI003A8832C5
MNIKVSIIIVTFNAEKTLKKAIQSVLNQTYKNIECLIIDGASTDSTVDIIRKYNVSYISEPDKGIYDAMNKGWKQAKGDWILYLGADDELVPNSIETLINISSDADVVYGDTILKFPSGNTKKRGIQDLSLLKYYLCSSHQSFMMKRCIFENLDGFNSEYRIFGDFDLIQRAYLKGYKFKETKEVISIFYVGGVSTNNIKAEKERYKILKRNKSVRYPFFICFYVAVKKLLLKIKHLYS